MESNRNEYPESSWGKGWPACKADNLTVICEPIVKKMWHHYKTTELHGLLQGQLQLSFTYCLKIHV
jgi:hypothetical protein